MHIFLMSILLLFLSCNNGINFDLPGCMKESACNYDETATLDDDTCYYSEDDCTICVPDILLACTYIFDPVCGCDGFTYSNICNAEIHVLSTAAGECYNNSSIVDGCTDPNACNYNPATFIDNNSCEYPEENYDCDGNCIDCPDPFGSSQSFDLLTWNIENFPKNNNTINQLTEIIPLLEVDIIALQEIENSESLEELKNNLGENWTFYKAYSDPGYGALSYLINTDEVQINQTPYTILPYDYEFAWRHPYVLNITHDNSEYTIINIHYKAMGGSENEERRLRASILLEDYILTYLTDDNVILLGDFNDLLIDDPNVFEPFLDKPDDYYFTDMQIASGSPSYWSYPSWPSHLDHILITNELFENSYDIQTLLIGEDFFSSDPGLYEDDISDHRPVGIRIQN